MRCSTSSAQPFAENLVVVDSPGIAGDAPISRAFVGSLLCVIVHADRNNRTATWEHQGGIGPAFRVAGHPGHGGVIPASKPFSQSAGEVSGGRGVFVVRRVEGFRRHGANTHDVEAEVAGGLLNTSCERGGHYGFEQSNRTINCPVHWVESHRVHWPVMRVFQSVVLASNEQKVRPALETVVQGFLVPGKWAMTQPDGIGT